MKRHHNGIRSFGGAPSRPPENRPIHTQYGHNGTHVVMVHDQPVTTNVMTPEQCLACIKCLQEAHDALLAHQAAPIQ